MTWIEALLLVGTGIIAGALNTLAGGGSLLTLPLLIFMGLPSAEANASNRVAIILQNIFSVSGFRSKGVSVFPFALWLALSATAGAYIGATIAVDIDDTLFNRILAIIMIVVIILTVFKRSKKGIETIEQFSKGKLWTSIVLFFGVGIYGGFIQAGVGFLMIAALTGVHSLNMSKTNSIKVFVALTYTTLAVIVFIIEDIIRWDYGLTLAVGNAIGGWLSSRWSVDKDDKWIKMILVVTVTALSIKLWFFSS